MAKIVKNLSLEPEAIACGERYGRSHSLVRRLRGIAAGGKAGREEYRKGRYRKYGAR